MEKVKTLKRISAILLALALLTGMVSVCGVFSFVTSAETVSVDKFVADFSELKGILDANGVGWNDSDSYDPAYTTIGDTTSVDGKLNTWMREKFVSKTNHLYSSTRAWFGQHSNEISDLEEAVGWRNYASFDVGNGSLRYKLGGGSSVGAMLRRVDTLIPQYSGTNVKLKNFEAKLTLTMGQAGFRGGFLFSFHENKAGSMQKRTDGVYNGYRYYVTGSTLVIGNGTGNGTTVGKDGWVFYNNQKEISATSVDESHNTTTPPAWYELKLTDLGNKVTYERFDRTLNDQRYTLTVRVVNGTVTFTLESADGAFRKTLTSAVDTTEGYLSLGVANRDTNFYSLEITELDEKGDAVAFGTYHNGAVNTFEADFTDLPDAQYVNSTYLYNTNHDSSTGKTTGLTGADATTVTTAGAYTSGTTYEINVKDKAMVDYLEDKFNFYVYAVSGGNTMERWNAAGYYVDADGNTVSSAYANNGVTAHNPALGSTDGDWGLGNGKNGGYASYYPTMKVSENCWLQLMPDYGAHPQGWFHSADPFNATSFFTVQDNGDNAALKNFRLDLDFKLTSPGDSYLKVQSPVFVKFGGYDSVTKGCTDGAMFAVAYNGGYFLDDLSTTYSTGYGWDSSANAYSTSVTFTENTFTQNITANALNFPSYAGTTIGGGEMHLTLTVKNGTVNAKITDASGNTVLDVTKNDIKIQSGLIQIGTTYAGAYHGMPYFGAVKVTRLDADGNSIDFDGADDSFEASFVGLTDVIDGNYYRNNGNKDKAILLGKALLENAWLSGATAVNDSYTFSAEDAAVADYLNEKFDFYYASPGGKLQKMESPYQDTYTLYADTVDGVENHGQWKLFGGRMLRATFTRGAYWADLFRNQLTLVPKIQEKPVYMADFKAEFDYTHLSDTYNCAYSTLLFTFRSGAVAETARAGNTAFADAVTVAFTHYGVSVYDGTVADRSNNGHTGTDQYLFGGNINAAHVEMQVKDNVLTLKVTALDGATVYTNQEITLENCTDAGYAYFSVLNSDMSLADIQIDPMQVENAAAPDGIKGGVGEITGLSEGVAYQYRYSDVDEWTTVANVNAITGLTENGMYQVRLAETYAYKASAATTVFVHIHNWSTAYKQDHTTHHWYDCLNDGCSLLPPEMMGYGEHTYDNNADTNCNICDAAREITTPTIVVGANSSIEIDGVTGLSFASDAAFGDFSNAVLIDGNEIVADNYTVTDNIDNQTVVVLKAIYLATLAGGEHTIGIVSLTGTATAKFTVILRDSSAVVNQETGIITVHTKPGYQLRAGSLLVKDANGNYFVPERVGFRNGGDASQYKVPENAVAPYTVEADFYQPTIEDINMGLVGYSYTDAQGGGLRFVHRLNITEENGKLYMMLDGENVEVKEYGLLLAAQTIVKDPQRLTIKVADESMHVQRYVWPTVNRYFDKCEDYVDVAIHITGIETAGGGNINIITRTYVELADGTVVYGIPAVDNYNAVRGM